MDMPKITAPCADQTYIVKDNWGKLVRLHVCNPGGYYIEVFNHMGGVYAGLKHLAQPAAQEILETGKSPF